MPLRRRVVTIALASVIVLSPLSSAAIAAPVAPVAAAAQTKSTSIRSWAKQQWGTFSTWTRSGTGDDVLTVPKGVKAAIVKVSHDGESNFIVWALDRKNEHVDLLTNEIGVYSATTLFGLEDKGQVRGLEIQADGDWTITLKPVHAAAALPKRGDGAGVYLLASHRAAKIAHEGESNFIVWQHQGGRYGRNLLVNEIGDYSGTVRLDRGRSVVEVDADGSWTISPR